MNEDLVIRYLRGMEFSPPPNRKTRERRMRRRRTPAEQKRRDHYEYLSRRLDILSLGIGEAMKRACGADSIREVLSQANELLPDLIREVELADERYFKSFRGRTRQFRYRQPKAKKSPNTKTKGKKA